MARTFTVSARKVGAIIAAAGVFAVVSASAATLGGLQTSHVGANSNDVASPITKGVSLAWDTSYDATEKAYVVDGITLAALDAGESLPATATISVTVSDASGTSLGEYTSTNGGQNWTAPAAPVTAHDIERASVVINGGATTAVVTATD